MRLIRLVKLLFLAAVLYVIAIPFLSPKGTNFGITEGLFFMGGILFTYAVFGRKGLVLQPIDGRKFDVVDVLLLGAFPLYLIYFGNERYLSSLDTVPSRELPVAILQNGTMNLAGQRLFNGKSSHYELVEIEGQKLSAFPIGTAFLALPYTAAALFASGGNLVGERSLLAEKQFSALIAVATGVLFFFALRKRFGEKDAAKTGVVFSLATGMFSCASQAMWSFTGEMFFLTLALFLSVNLEKKYFAGLAAGAAFLCRPTAIVLVGIAALFFYRSHKNSFGKMLLMLFLSFSAAVGVLILIYGHPLGGYGMINAARSEWNLNFFEGLAGNLFSSSRGLLVFFPFLIPSLFVLFRAHKFDTSFAASLLCIAAILLVNSSYAKWWGGHSLGPRLLTETSLFVAMLTIPMWQKSGWVKFAFLVLLAFSICTQFLLVYNPMAAEWSSIVQIDAHPALLWEWNNSQLAAAWAL